MAASSNCPSISKPAQRRRNWPLYLLGFGVIFLARWHMAESPEGSAEPAWISAPSKPASEATLAAVRTAIAGHLDRDLAVVYHDGDFLQIKKKYRALYLGALYLQNLPSTHRYNALYICSFVDGLMLHWQSLAPEANGLQRLRPPSRRLWPCGCRITSPSRRGRCRNWPMPWRADSEHVHIVSTNS